MTTIGIILPSLILAIVCAGAHGLEATTQSFIGAEVAANVDASHDPVDENAAGRDGNADVAPTPDAIGEKNEPTLERVERSRWMDSAAPLDYLKRSAAGEDFASLVGARPGSRSATAATEIDAITADLGRPPMRRIHPVGATVDGDTDAGILAETIPPTVAGQIADVLGWEPGFVSELEARDSLHAAIEQLPYQGPTATPPTRVAAWNVTRDGEHHEGFYFETDDGSYAGYYDRSGQALGTSPVSPPVESARISSHFSPDRLHPVLKTRRPHYGVDYAAPVGTPIKAVADGTVGAAGWQGAGGKVVRIGHHGGYQSHYAHLSRIAAGLEVGSKVEKGQVIGYVGTTGLSSGPHLHFAISNDGVYVDPLTARLPRGASLSGPALARFNAMVGELDLARSKAARGANDSEHAALAMIDR